MTGDARSEPSGVNIAPWLAVADTTEALAFYRAAFAAVELYRLEGDDGSVAVAQLSVGGADFWIQQDGDVVPEVASRSPVRMILTVEDPDPVFDRAIAAGATEVAPIEDDHGWRIGRLADPAGHHWEIGTPIEDG
jgi:PhnB protein